MKTRRRNLSATTERNKRSKTSEDGRGNALPIPIDLVLEIFSRLPVKSIAIARCVSKTWSSVLRRPDFTELFLSRCRARPKLLLACQKGGDLFFFSAPQPQNPGENSCHVVATYHLKLSFYAYFRNGAFGISCLDHGLVGLANNSMVEEMNYSEPVICNPSTGQSLPLTRVKTRRVKSRSLFGYDPIDKLVKVLSMSGTEYGSSNVVAEEYQVMTLGTRKLSQRMIDCGRELRYCPYWKKKCINGVLYYPSFDIPTGSYVLVCFNVRSEKFSFIELEDFHLIAGTMIDYNGKLGLLLSEEYASIDESSTSVNLWVLEDIQKQQWSEHVYVLPPVWKDIVGSAPLSFVGMTRTNEIVMESPAVPFHLFYFNTKRNTIVRVEIQGIDVSKYDEVHIFLDHVENVKLM